MSTSSTQPNPIPGLQGPDSDAADPAGTDVTGAGLTGVDLSTATWRKSSHSNGATNCVEVAQLPDGSVGVRHSRRPDGAVIVYSRSEWAAFLAGVKAEEFEFETA